MKKFKQRRYEQDKTKPADEIYNPDMHPPRFSFRLIVKESKYSYHSLNQEQKIALINRLNVLGNVSWKDLRTLDRNKGYEIINREQLHFTVPNEVPKDYNIIRFRFCDAVAMLGYRSAFGTFYIIAFDTKFKAYNHG